ncbi:hypothetical protein GCM10010394_34170 [Streptomyces crystallinus]|uniref:Flp pilus assembly protein RcpC/CpaB domain-containing protein n=2 Tax=Streptomyces crystallinus TaxID=68191 RepID=A0ABP3R6X4_9ACTN
MAAGLAVAAAALAAVGARAPGHTDAGPAESAAVTAASAAGLRQPGAAPGPASRPARKPVDVVSAPVRIADAETVRLLRPGDRVDVIAAAAPPAGGSGGSVGSGEARLVASGARVTDVPRPRGPSSDEGALVVLSVPRATATALAGAGASSRLAVAWC